MTTTAAAVVETPDELGVEYAFGVPRKERGAAR